MPMTTNPELQLSDVIAKLKQLQGAGTQAALARRLHVSEMYISDLLKGRREPGDGVLAPLGLERVVVRLVTYRRKPTSQLSREARRNR